MKYPLWICLFFSMQVMAQQPLSLQRCYELATQNYPLIKQRELINRSGAYSVENAGKGNLPQLSFSGQATYQSEVVRIPLPNIPALSKDQYKVQAELSQNIYDGGNIKYQKELERATTATQQQQLEVNLYAVKDRVNQLFFGILLADEQLKQNALRKTDIESGIHKMQGAVDNGTALRSSLDELKAELINTDQLQTQLTATKKGYVQMLALFINQPVTTLEKPERIPIATAIKRPELHLYDEQQQSLTIREKQLRVNYLPKISAFAQGGYGRPTLNIISNNFGFYGLGGLRFSWGLNSLYTLKNNRQLLHINQQDLDVQKETFLFNTRLTLTQQQINAQQYDDLISQDEEIIRLRTSVKNAAVAQLENGVITSHDYISQVNAENLARQNLVLHEIQLLQVQYNSKNTSGN
jgi:outer membrane protein TolC